jgi:hypothetical protein
MIQLRFILFCFVLVLFEQEFKATKRPATDGSGGSGVSRPSQKVALGWEEEDQEKGLRIVILKNVFDHNEANEAEKTKLNGAADFYDEVKRAVGVECERACGEIVKLTVFANNKEGAVAVKFRLPAAARKCVEVRLKVRV